MALASVVDVDDQYHEDYFHRKGSMINPWGGVEAMLTHAVSMLFSVPTAHFTNAGKPKSCRFRSWVG